MWPFWEHAIEPLLDAAGARTVVEVGAEQGRTTRPLLVRAARVGGVVHAIDPAPRLDVSRWELEHGRHLQFHRARSVDVLGDLPGLDAALIDGDHNWHTVHSELTLLARRADTDGAALPLIVAHDAGWPYGRRDMYYDPQALPDTARQDAARAGIRPGVSELSEGGINATYWNATREGGPRNGVLTALEDFAGERAGVDPCELLTIPGWHGLAVLASEARMSQAPPLRAALRRLGSAEYLRQQAERLEVARVASAGTRTLQSGPVDDRSVRDRGLLDED